MDEDLTPTVTLRFRAISPDGKKPEGWREWPTWSGMPLETVLALRDEHWRGYVLQVERTTEEPWAALDEPGMVDRVDAALDVYAEHLDFLTQRGARPDRAGDCVCLGCRMARALKGEPEPADGLLTVAPRG